GLHRAGGDDLGDDGQCQVEIAHRGDSFDEVLRRRISTGLRTKPCTFEPQRTPRTLRISSVTSALGVLCGSQDAAGHLRRHFYYPWVCHAIRGFFLCRCLRGVLRRTVIEEM